MIFLIYFCISYYIVGAHFDDGGNYVLEDEEDEDGAYDDVHNDYIVVHQGLVTLLQVFRTSISDLQPPQYSYWQARYELGDLYWAQFMIYLIWLLWIGQIVLIVICMFNFLIAIVSDSYNFVMESEKMSQITRRQFISY